MYFSIINKKIVFLLFLILTVSQFNYSQITKTNIQNNDRKLLLKIKNADRSEFRYIPKKPGHYTAQDWRAVIDSTWGEGLPTATKLQLFDRFWNDVDTKYPSFFNLNVNWDSLKSVYRPEIEAGVSRGRFAAIMCRMSSALLDLHTTMKDRLVSTDSLKPGTPIFVVDGSQSAIDREYFNKGYCHFGASLSPLPDSSLLVYDVVPNHPLGLERGDVVLGYDGIPWKKLYKELLADELPLYSFGHIGSNPESAAHMLLTSAGENWHLFDTIDVVKYNNGDTLHLPTSLLQNKKMKLLTTGQLPVPGVPFPDVDHGHWVSWGVIDGTTLGYIYVWNWTANGDESYPTTSTGDDFRSAIENLINDYKITGLIIDSRYNTGGRPSEYLKGLNILFNEDQDTYQAYIRNSPTDHYSMTQYNSPFTDYDSRINATRYLFDRPIAVLTGPESISGGDLMPLQMRYHPMVRRFGLGTNGAFGASQDFDISNISADWGYARTIESFELRDDPNRHLTHLNISPDEEVWFTKESVVKGKDDVVNAALNWITTLTYAHDVAINCRYTPPGQDSVLITARLANPLDHPASVSTIVTDELNVVRDSLLMLNDGLHGDGSAGDSIWGCYIQVPSDENVFDVSVRTDDNTSGTFRRLPDVVRFTTAGPLKITSVTYAGDSTLSPGKRLTVALHIANVGHQDTLRNVGFSFSCPDTLISFTLLTGTHTTIAPGDTLSLSHGIILINSDAPDQHRFPVVMTGTVDGAPLWSDTVWFTVVTTGVIAEEKILPKAYSLAQNYPNPFNPSTTIRYSIPKLSYVTLKIYDILGREAATIVNEEKPAGIYTVRFSVGQPDLPGSPDISSGIYFYQIKAGDYVSTKKMILLK